MTETRLPPSYDTDLFSNPAAPWLMLACLPKFGVRRRQAVRAATAELTDILALNPATLRAMGLPPETVAGVQAWQARDLGHPVPARVAAIVRDCQRLGVDMMCWQDPDYPDALRHIHDAPLVLYTLGDRRLLGQKQIAVVGSRHASRDGLAHARAFAAALSERELVVTSGLALGVDGAAHAGALDAGYPTIAVIGSGLDRIYPSQHRELAQRIAGQGLLVSEYPPGTPARPGHFPRRNRVISGLSCGVLVVEAGLKSGSLITARLALEQGRDVFAIPGSVHNPQARGCHHLIRQGACLVESADDIVAELGNWCAPLEAVPGGSEAVQEAAPAVLDLSALDEREIAVFEALGYDPQSTDALSSATGLPADQLMQSLLLLELQGLVTSVPGGFQRIT